MVAVWRRMRLPLWVGLWPVSAASRTPGVGSGRRPRRRPGRRTILGVPEAPSAISFTPTGPRLVNRGTIGLRNSSQGDLQPSESLAQRRPNSPWQIWFPVRVTAGAHGDINGDLLLNSHNNHNPSLYYFTCDARMESNTKKLVKSRRKLRVTPVPY